MGILVGSEWRKKIVHLEPESDPSTVVALTFGKMKNNSWLSIEDRYLICLLLGGVVGRESLGLFAWKYAKYVEFFKTGRTDDRWRGDLQWQILRIFRVSSNNNRTTIAFVYVKEVCRCVVPVWSWISSKYHQRSSLWSIKYFVQILQGSCYLPHLIHQFIPTESDVFIFSFLRSPSLRFGFMSFWVILTWLQRWWMARLLGYCKWDATFSMLWGGFFLMIRRIKT